LSIRSLLLSLHPNLDRNLFTGIPVGLPTKSPTIRETEQCQRLSTFSSSLNASALKSAENAKLNRKFPISSTLLTRDNIVLVRIRSIENFVIKIRQVQKKFGPLSELISSYWSVKTSYRQFPLKKTVIVELILVMVYIS